MFFVRRLQELEREMNIPLFMWFVDPQNEYNFFDRERLWKVPALHRTSEDACSYSPIPRRHADYRAYRRRRAHKMI